MSNQDWYQTKSWYAPLSREREATPEPEMAEPQPQRRGKLSAVFLGVISLVLVAALLAGLVLPSLHLQLQNGRPVLFARAAQGETKTDSGDSRRESSDRGFSFPIRPTGEGEEREEPGADPDEEEDDEDSGMPENPEDFFNGFYQETDTSSAVVNIPRGELPEGFTLQLSRGEGEQLSLQQLYERCAPSIVAISGYTDGQTGYNWGTGVVLSQDGLILTNTHVIDQCDRATVTLANDQEFEARLIGADTLSDLVVLKIDAEDLVPAVFGESGSMTVGDPVAAIGNPLGNTFRCTLTDGIISGISRDISYKGRTMTLLQTNAALNEGNSGGALFNMQGQVVGITNMKMMSSYSSIEGIGFAIPSTTVEEVVNSMVRFGEVRGRPSIGITVGPIPETALDFYKLPKGLYITDVTESSDAWAKGIRPYDVLTEVNSIPVSTTEEVSDIKNEYGVGDILHLTIWRNGEYLEFDVELMDTNDIYGR